MKEIAKEADNVWTKKPRGLASMTPEKRREIASKGGKAAHALGRAHKWKEGKEAQEAGRKGGSIGRRRPGGDKA